LNQSIDEWTVQYADLYTLLSKRATYSRILAYSVLIIICVLLGGAAIVFLLPQRFSASTPYDPAAAKSSIDAKITDIKSKLEPILAITTGNQNILSNKLSALSAPDRPNTVGTVIIDDDGSVISKEAILKAFSKVVPATSSSAINVNVQFQSESSEGTKGITTFKIKLDNGLDTVSTILSGLDFKQLSEQDAKDIVNFRSQLEALTATQGLLKAVLEEKQVTQLTGLPISFYSNILSNTDSRSGADWHSVIEPNITRFGTMLIVSFLVSILVPLYRYNIRIAAFYQAEQMDCVSSKPTCGRTVLSV